jgi:hypothetical protein
MTPEEINHRTIVVAPLDWGMGHLTRCLPLIKLFISNNNKVIFAGTSFQCGWIQNECEGIITEKIEGYKITLDSEKPTYWQILSQSAKMIKIFKREQDSAHQLVQKYEADLILSDNRYGFRSDACQNILLTHQLSPPVPKLRSFVSKKITKWVNEFDFCWVPDREINGVCKGLNETELSIPKIYISWLSRFTKKAVAKTFDYCFIASGPKPQIELFTNRISGLLQDRNHILIVPFDMGLINQVINPSTSELNALINASETVISRAGYTTIMELQSLAQHSILIPTPGQFEQEYLARTVCSKHINFIQEVHLDQVFTSLID